MDRLVEAARPVPYGRARKHAQGAREDRGFVGEDVAEEVLGYEYIERTRVGDELHRRGVDELVLELNPWELCRHPGHDLAPEPGGLEDVGLVDGGYEPTPG